jgi:hypothetical protein
MSTKVKFFPDDSYQSSIVGSLHSQQQTGLNLDIKLLSGGHSVFIHSAMLLNSSPMLASLLRTPCFCSQPTDLILPPVYSPILSDFVSLLYLGYVADISKDKVKLLVSLATEVGIHNLSSEISEPESYTAAVPRVNVLKLKTVIEIFDGENSFKLSFPKSRTDRQAVPNLENFVELDGFKGRIQKEYNVCPVGPYAGPYDQNENLELKIQLPKSNLDYENYTEYIHDEEETCRKFKIKKSYVEKKDLEKIDTFEFAEMVEFNEEKETEGTRISYTCQRRKCEIPCPCTLCCTNRGQCSLHKIKHPELFNENEHAVSIRSTEQHCEDVNFFASSYINKYSGIPVSCSPCSKDLLHHNSYHLTFHYACKFCNQNWYKLYPTNMKEFNKQKHKEDYYYRCVCPHCDKIFSEPYIAKKHIENFHQKKASFNCDECNRSFQSKQAKEYHQSVHHSDKTLAEKCIVCEKSFPSKVSLENHVNYVHSNKQKYSCKDCDAKFKQKKNLRAHTLRVHDINQYKEVYHDREEPKKFQCGQCNSSYKNKNDLNHHHRVKHENPDDQTFECELCAKTYMNKKSLSCHVKLKHTDNPEEHICPKCGKIFHQKKVMRRHLITHT